MDAKTLIFTIISINAFLGLITVVIKKRLKLSDVANYWFISNFLVALGWTLLLLRTIVPDIFSVVMANMLFLTALFYKIFGFRKLYNKPIHYKPIYAIILMVYFVLFLYFTSFQNNILIRNILVTAFLGSTSVYIGIIVLKNKAGTDKIISVFTSLTFFTLSLLLLIRIIGWILFSDVRSIFANSIFNNLLLFPSIFIDLSWTTMFLLILYQRTFSKKMEIDSKYRLLFDKSPEAIAITDGQGKIVDCNFAALQISNLQSKDDLSNLNTAQFYASIEEQNKVIEELKAHGRVLNRETTLKLLNNEKRTVLLSVEPLIIGENEPLWVSWQRDISELKNISEELEKSKERFELAVKGSNDGIWDWDIVTNHLYMSETWKQQIGYSDLELANEFESFKNNLHPDDTLRVMEYVERYFNNEFEKYDIEFRLRHKNGTYRWIRARGEVLRDGDGKPYRMAGSHSDITDLKESQLFLENFFNLNLDLLCIADTKGNFLKLNKSWENILGYKISELEKRQFLEFVHPEDINITLDAMALLDQQKEVINFVNRYRCNDGTYRFIEWRSHPVGNTIFAAARDITEHLNIKQQLLKLNADKDRFISILAHDLRNPFNSLLGFSELLMVNLRHYNRKEIEEKLQIIHKSANQTYDLLEQILLWAKTQSGKLIPQPEAFEFIAAFKNMLQLVEYPASLKKISINCFDVDEIVLNTDLNMFQTILRNLISNAIKFTNQNGLINISALKINNEAVISVADNGIGIEPEMMTKLWDVSGFQSSTGTYNEKGTGFGLILCKDLIEKLGGKIWVESEPGKGSEFKFTIPLHNQ